MSSEWWFERTEKSNQEQREHASGKFETEHKQRSGFRDMQPVADNRLFNCKCHGKVSFIGNDSEMSYVYCFSIIVCLFFLNLKVCTKKRICG